MVSLSLHTSLVSFCGERESFVLSFCCEFLLICHLLFDFLLIFVNFHLFVVIWLFLVPLVFAYSIVGRCVCWHVLDFFFLPQVVDYQSSSRFSLVILCLCGCCFLAFLAFDSFSLVWIVTFLRSFYIFLYLSLFIVCLHFYGLFTTLCSWCASLWSFWVCDFLFIFCYLVVIVAVLLNLQFILVILHLFVAAWGLTSVSLFWRFCNFCCYCVFWVSLWLMCVSLYWISFPFVDFWLLVFFGPFVPFWCNFTFLCSCLMCLSMKTDDSHSTVNRGSDSETSYLPLSLHACIYSIKKAAFHPDHTSEVELMMMIETWNSTAEMLCVCSV